jgi:hypothetical protein
MEDGREQKLADIKHRIEQGEYRVDPNSVANAILERLGGFGLAGSGTVQATEDQNKCSYPVNPARASVNTTPAGPSTARPTHFRSVSPLVFWLLGGMQAQIS